MDIYVLPSKHEKEFVELCESLKVAKGATVETLKKSGFTNYYEPHLYWCKHLYADYDVSFSVVIDKFTLEIKEFDILDENFLQPFFCNDREFKIVQDMIRHLINVGVLEYYYGEGE